MYLPAGWSHMTINPTEELISEAISLDGSPHDPTVSQEIPNVVIGIGAQKIWDTTERVHQCSRILFSSAEVMNELSSPSALLTLLQSSAPDYECYKSLGNIYKQKSHELLTQFSNLSSPYPETTICIFLQYAVEFYR